ncbi:bifunctional proline dehydrogenase/L-glutamate gamma-semialdehyde dehydrogenase PutA [Cocleimonas sp. KMM 6892]|uniref:bifunctional proline dehydrogenase/L-glutamate gamma-semialdehyde dehydrogenase PutA n=1 Tax=unclassified Cocleimonas TaxID=2639732 RepID=UPI002DBED26C|nr:MULTISPECIES: bifunctional proline dehydrogenase/L-glutamate gamma-semialdehyde dehydrogenase PutA [unclassified Cocleimonas]MEB8432761.1 bifunctional proline dehydrogenase/L-glutamate gamma-semialdehyde dehydrogenase PutA [Cocleimonas sp. KMM 6892]MEC4715620.1 bifunctional proline dehydrogenase/L-glutamate gamma-semialdehyde dehydrogenase PutA [Cocleimonas sp. KMM 6895]MEC4744762.1 bifunctional proline dehydrogenase/L-glutamate gamma-semialdehyde dehydrogenase PutA [Cocleimonas sp. KMM 6896]
MSKLSDIRETLRAATLGDEAVVVKQMLDDLDIDEALRQSTVDMAASWVRDLRASGDPGLMESFLAEYGLSTQEGVALMCMAEAYLRVPDNKTLDDLIQDKIAPQNFGDHLGHSSSMMVNASTWGLMLTGSVLSDSDQRGLMPALQKVVKRAGEPIIRVAVKRMMKMMGGQFVLGESIESAIDNGTDYTKKGYRYSFDMLGEAAYTLQDADKYYLAYADAITELVEHCNGKDVRLNPGISVKLSALYPRYETLHKEDVMKTLYPSLRSLCLLAKKAGIGLNIDAEEAERLDISLDIIEALLEDGSLQGWEGLGIVVQAYGYRAPHVLDWLYELAEKYDTKLMVRLVKGAYWDREVKRSQELGLPGYPVYTRKNNSDLSYWYCAKKLLGQRDRIFPQFATHNAHTIASIIKLTEQEEDAASTFEFQRLHGMGESLHELVRNKHNFACRIYAPVGVHQDLLAYLVRRLLENGANASFVSQVLDNQIPPSEVTADPVKKAEAWLAQAVPGVAEPDLLFMPERVNSKGFDWLDVADIQKMESMRTPFKTVQWTAEPMVVGAAKSTHIKHDVFNPATGEVVGWITDANAEQLDAAVESAHKAQPAWQQLDVIERGRILNKAADLYEENAGEFFALLSREAGKSIVDCIAELREAVDFLRYYAAQAEHIAPNKQACGVMACISPWNFPLAIFSGQLSAGLAVGNAVLVKPAESTSLIAYKAVQLLHEAGVPEAILQYLPGQGSVIGAGLSSHPDINGMIFTGSTATAKHIERSMSQSSDVRAPLIAETGGLNAMIVDSSALPEQAITDIVASAFQSAGQRCSALRVLYLQEDIAEHTLEMLYGSMELLRMGNPWNLNVDVGPVIDETAAKGITDYIEENKASILKQTPMSNVEKDVASTGFFVPPTVIKVNGIQDLSREIFGPVLHVATFSADEIDEVVDAVNNAGFGLTFGLHTRIDSRVQQIVDNLKAGNMYVNRNQIGAIVGSQPFGGEGLSGTGPKAGGPFYLKRLVHEIDTAENADQSEAAEIIDTAELNNSVQLLLKSSFEEFGHLLPLDAEISQDYLGLINRCRQDLHESRSLPGPTGEDNLLSLNPRGLTIIATPNADVAFQQAIQALYCGNPILVCNENFNKAQQDWLTQHPNVILNAKGISPKQLEEISDLTNFAFTAANDDQIAMAREYRIALANRDGAIVRFINEAESPYLYAQERHLCINTTAAGGNVQLIANSE